MRILGEAFWYILIHDASRSLPSKILILEAPEGFQKNWTITVLVWPLGIQTRPAMNLYFFGAGGFVMLEVGLGNLLIRQHPHHLQSMPHSPLESPFWRSGHWWEMMEQVLKMFASHRWSRSIRKLHPSKSHPMTLALSWQKSQKVLTSLLAEFARSPWCTTGGDDKLEKPGSIPRVMNIPHKPWWNKPVAGPLCPLLPPKKSRNDHPSIDPSNIFTTESTWARLDALVDSSTAVMEFIHYKASPIFAGNQKWRWTRYRGDFGFRQFSCARTWWFCTSHEAPQKLDKVIRSLDAENARPWMPHSARFVPRLLSHWAAHNWRKKRWPFRGQASRSTIIGENRSFFM